MAQQLKSIHYERPKDANDDFYENCGICCLEFDELEHLKQLDCQSKGEEMGVGETNSGPNQGVKHIFHQSCIQNWFKISVDCPICRANFKKDIKYMKAKTQSQLQQDQDNLQIEHLEAKNRIEKRILENVDKN